MSGDRRARFRWLIRGQVQGVGFRPCVYRLATEHRLAGFVRNDLAGATIEAQGGRRRLERFERELPARLPPLAVIGQCVREELPYENDGAERFCIEGSDARGALTAEIAPDAAVCSKCLGELFSSSDRRSGYPLINCTDCGPRYTIVDRLPYDRPNTSMAHFAMCEPCRREYESPADRRFHAQPIACRDCGPQVELVDGVGRRLPGDSIDESVKLLQSGAIVAVKGLGGYRLAVRADDQRAVARLRRLKMREAKSLAVMCASLAQAEQLVELGGPAAAELQSAARPIVLARRRSSAAVADDVAPGIDRLGVMLPSSPLEHLLWARRPQLGPLVMTSGNLGDEPLAIGDEEAIERLGPMCEALLRHDRPIRRRVDDSIVLDMGPGPPLPIRRARGYVPHALELPEPPPRGREAGLCVGGELKCTVTVVRGDQAIVSQHLGNLKHPLAWANFRETIGDLLTLYDVQPRWVACDRHPSYLSSVYAREFASMRRVPLLKVQHHHAHAAALLAEQRHAGPALAVVCDGVGYSGDGTVWGGELLAGDAASMQRVARLRPIALVGGDAAASDVRRSALGLLEQVSGEAIAEHPLAVELFPQEPERQLVAKLLRSGVNCVRSSAAGRLFDGVAGLLGICQTNRYEAEAPMLLEAAACRCDAPIKSPPLFELRRAAKNRELMEIDLRPLVERLVELRLGRGDVAVASRLLHDQLADAWEAAVAFVSERTGIRTVALSGGVFCNRLFSELLSERLERRGLAVLRHETVPPNDGGLSFGQAAAASARLRRRHAARKRGVLPAAVAPRG